MSGMSVARRMGGKGRGKEEVVEEEVGLSRRRRTECGIRSRKGERPPFHLFGCGPVCWFVRRGLHEPP